MAYRDGRRLVLLLSGSAIIQGVAFSFLAPILPRVQTEAGLSKGQLGLLVGSFAIGQGLAAFPVALMARRVGVRRITVSGLAVLGVTTMMFGVAGGFALLLVVRLAQGLGSGLCFAAGFAWFAGTSLRQHRARAIGTLSGAAAAGHAIGPLAGAAALDVGRVPVMFALSVAALGLAGFAARLPRPTGGHTHPSGSLRRAHRSLDMLGALWLIALPGALIGMVFTVAPLQLAEQDMGPNAIALTFLVAAVIGVVVRPIAGSWADRRGLKRGVGHLLTLALPLTVGAALVDSGVVLAVLILALVATYGAAFGPAMAYASSCYESLGVPLVVAFAMMAAIVGCALFAGAAVAGAIAESSGNGVPYIAATALMLASVGGIRRSSPTAFCRSDEDAVRP